MPETTPAWVVTGPTSGYGRATALQLASHGALVLVGRSPAKLAAAPLQASAQVRDPAFSDRYIAESRELLATVPSA